MTVKYPWITEAEKLIGIREDTKAGGEAVDQLWRDYKMSGLVGKAKSIPWCSGFVGGTLTRAGLSVASNTEYGKDNSQYWRGYGRKLDKPAYGCIVVFKWPWGGGHVGYIVGQSHMGSPLVLGGNQDDSVCVKAFRKDHIVAYRWPEGYGEPDYHLPVGDAGMIGSTR